MVDTLLVTFSRQGAAQVGPVSAVRGLQVYLRQREDSVEV